MTIDGFGVIGQEEGINMPSQNTSARPRAKRQVRRGRRHGRSGSRKRITVFLSAPLVKKLSRVVTAEEQSLEVCLEEALGQWLARRQEKTKIQVDEG